MKYIAILGSTGSIGQNTLEVIRRFPKEFKVLSLSANSNSALLYRQIKEFHPEFAAIKDPRQARALGKKVGPGTKVFRAQENLEELIRDERIEKIVLSISGSAALAPLLKAIDLGKDIALANKEALVMAGPIVMHKARAAKARIIPVDSEQSAIWQCLQGQDIKRLKNIYLTASGGPFRKASTADLRRASVAKVLRHPRWKMGRKITVDSATLMNKGLEVLEAMYLFGVAPQKIKVLIHPEAIIHSMVEFADNVVMAQMSTTDMRIPIKYALTYPDRLPDALPGLDFCRLGSLNFQKPDFEKFPCLKLAYQAAFAGGTAPCAMNAANEVSVEAFLKKKISFTAIFKVIKKVLDKHRNIKTPDLADIFLADAGAKKEARLIIEELS